MKKEQLDRVIAAQAIKSNQRVQQIGGKQKGREGVVFFVGNTSFGTRVGFKGDDGTKYWARPDQVVALTGPPTPVAQPEAAPEAAPAPGLTAQQRWQIVLDLTAQVEALTKRLAVAEAEVGRLSQMRMAKAGVPALGKVKQA